MSEAVAIDPIDIRICEYFNALTEEEKQREKDDNKKTQEGDG